MEPRESLIWYASAIPEALDNVVLHIAEQRDILSKNGQVIRSGCPCQVRRMLRRQVVADAFLIDADDARSDHCPEPFAHIALVEACSRGDFWRGQRRLITHRVEKAGAVSDGGHQAERAVVERAQEATSEGLGPLGIKRETCEIRTVL